MPARMGRANRLVCLLPSIRVACHVATHTHQSPNDHHQRQTLGEIKGLSEAKVDKMHDAATKYVPGAGWGSAKEALHRVSTSRGWLLYRSETAPDA